MTEVTQPGLKPLKSVSNTKISIKHLQKQKKMTKELKIDANGCLNYS